jgi:hypothetical protein
MEVVLKSVSKMSGFATLDGKFLKRLIDRAVLTDPTEIGTGLSVFAARLDLKLLIYFLNSAPLSLYPAILAQVKPQKEDYEKHLEPFVVKLLKTYPRPEVVKGIVSLRFARFFGKSVVERVLLMIVFWLQKAVSLDEICVLGTCANRVMSSCVREVAKASLLAIEIPRKISHLFAKRVSVESPTYKQLKVFSKLCAGVVRSANNDLLQYLIASFVAHVALIDMDNEKKMKSLQSSIFPLFAKCTRKQLGEISTALHDSHRQIFQQLYSRWQSEYEYNGKV